VLGALFGRLSATESPGLCVDVIGEYHALYNTARQSLTAENHSWQLTENIFGVAVGGSDSILVSRLAFSQKRGTL
jgi:hypothetical protein